MDPIGQKGDDYEMVYRKGFKITPEEQRTITKEGTVLEEKSEKNPPDRLFYVVEVYISDPDRTDGFNGEQEFNQEFNQQGNNGMLMVEPPSLDNETKNENKNGMETKNDAATQPTQGRFSNFGIKNKF